MVLAVMDYSAKTIVAGANTISLVFVLVIHLASCSFVICGTSFSSSSSFCKPKRLISVFQILMSLIMFALYIFLGFTDI